MIMLALISSLTGAVLGIRFKVTIMIPLTAIGVVGVGLISALAGVAFLTGLASAALCALALQMGYVGGLFIRFCLAASRAHFPAASRSVASRS